MRVHCVASSTDGEAMAIPFDVIYEGRTIWSSAWVVDSPQPAEYVVEIPEEILQGLDVSKIEIGGPVLGPAQAAIEDLFARSKDTL